MGDSLDGMVDQEVNEFDAASEVRAIIEGQILSMRAHVERFDSASSGAALRAAHGWVCNAKGSFIPFECIYKDRLEKTSFTSKLSAKAGDPTVVTKYTLMMKKRMEIEKRLVEKLGRW